MSEIDNICAEVFYENQEQLFPKQVVADIDEAIDFLEECMKDEGIDISDYEDVSDALEVFALPDGRYLYVEA